MSNPSPTGSLSSSPLARRPWWDSPVPFLLLWMFLLCCFPLFDADLFWHLKTGEWILQHSSIPHYDLYTYTDYDKRWVDLHWGFQVVAASLYRLGGANLLILVKATVLTVALGVGCYTAGSGLLRWQRALCWILPAITFSYRDFRPEIITVLCLVLWLAIVTRMETRPRLIWLLPLIQVIWINFHALYILGLVVGACYAADYIVRLAAGGRFGLAAVPKALSPTVLIGAGCLCLFASLANPYHVEGAMFPFVLLRKFAAEHDAYAKIGELAKPITLLSTFGFTNLYIDAEILLWLAAAMSFVLLAMRRRVSVFRALLFVCVSYLAWSALRNLNVFSMVAGFVLAENLGEFRSRPTGATERQPKEVDQHPMVGQILIVLLMLMSAAVITGVWNDWLREEKPFALGERKNWYAHKAAIFMQRPGFPRRVFANMYQMASVYTYHNAPEGKVFMDGRLEVCSRETFGRFEEIYKRMAAGDPDWVTILRDSEGNLPALMFDSRYSQMLTTGVLQTPGWRLVYADESAAVIIEDRVADALELPAVSAEPYVMARLKM